MLVLAWLRVAGIIHNVFRIPFRAGVAKSVDAVDSKSTVEIRAGSSPAFGTISNSKTIRESPPNPLKSILEAIFTS